MAVLKPEVEEVAQAHDAFAAQGAQAVEEADKLVPDGPGAGAALEVDIGEEDGGAPRRPNLLRGQTRSTARPTICPSFTARKLRLSLLTLRWSPIT